MLDIRLINARINQLASCETFLHSNLEDCLSCF